MKGDFSRSTFNRKKHYSSVRLQQGRVQLDSDWNEHLDIETHLRETRARDMIGNSGVPNNNLGGGFKVGLSADNQDLTLSAGRIYVEGILCENEADVRFLVQPDFPKSALPADTGTYLAYLDVWRRHITALEDPALREVALGGPETTTRLKTVWQLKLEKVNDSATGKDFSPDWRPESLKTTGSLVAFAASGSGTPDNCLYRVEIHDSGNSLSDQPTFKWSRDNGALAGRIEPIMVGGKIEYIVNNIITVSMIGCQPETVFAPGQWVELSDEERVLRGEPGVFVQLRDVQGNKLILVDSFNAPALGTLPSVRRWDSPNGPIALTVGNNIALENGVQVRFGPGEYRSGNYWFFPTRAITRQVEWPQDALGQPVLQPAHGIKHHYARLALVIWDTSKKTFVLREDCRFVFSSLELNAVQSDANAPFGALCINQAGNVGIGTTNPPARLSVIAPGATELSGTARSATLLTGAGALENTVGSELTLATIGFRSPNSTSLGIRALRTDTPKSGVGWKSTAIGLGMDVDNTIRAGGASLWLHANGNVGIGTTTPSAKLEVNGMIKSPMWNVTQVFNMRPGALPLESQPWNTAGGTLLIFASGSGYQFDIDDSYARHRPIGMSIIIDGHEKGIARGYTNEKGSHKTFTTNALVVTDVPPGSHTITLEAWNSTITNGADVFSVTVLELPFLTQSPYSNMLVEPLQLDFGAPPNRSATLPLVLKNTGSAPLEITGCLIDATRDDQIDQDDFYLVGPASLLAASPHLTINPQDTATITIGLRPAAVTLNKSLRKNLTIRSNNPAQPTLIVPLIGLDIHINAKLDDTSAFGSPGKTRELTISNDGYGTLGVGLFTISSNFSIVETLSYPLIIGPHGTKTLTIKQGSGSTKTGSLRIDSDDPDPGKGKVTITW